MPGRTESAGTQRRIDMRAFGGDRQSLYLWQFDFQLPDPLLKLVKSELRLRSSRKLWKLSFQFKIFVLNRHSYSTRMASTGPAAGYGEPDENYGPKLVAATSAVTVIALISVILRLWVRAGIIKSVGWDDRFIVMAMASGPSISRSHELLAPQGVH